MKVLLMLVIFIKFSFQSDAYFEIDATKFKMSESWFVESIDIADNQPFYNIFWYKSILYCLIFEIRALTDAESAMHLETYKLQMRARFENSTTNLFALKGTFKNFTLTDINYHVVRMRTIYSLYSRIIQISLF